MTLSSKPVPQVVIVSDTGSCCYGKNPKGQSVELGGWGHLLGDKGSGYEIGLRALKASVYRYDESGAWPKLGERLLRALQFNEPADLIGWAEAATKSDIAGLANEVFLAWEQRDKIASDILTAAAKSLARSAATCARRLATPGTRIQFVLAGSTLVQHPRFATQVARELRQLWPAATVTPLKSESIRQLLRSTISKAASSRSQRSDVEGLKSGVTERKAETAREGPIARSARLSPTEERNPRSMNLHKLPLAEAIKLMLSEEAGVPKKLMTERRAIEQVVRAIVRAFHRGGRLFYVGAGTSGRLGVLDASECPPTFRTPPDLVQGIIAGGQAALWKAVEGAEDDAGAGRCAIEFRGITRRDVVVGIAASGRTPFVWGALAEAKRRGATTILLCFNPFLQIPRAVRPTIILGPKLGPEILTGSTRLKSGTATKVLLNIFTTLAMVRLGKVSSNLMIDLQPGNEKLRDRAVRIVQELTGVNYARAQGALNESGWAIKKAVERLT